MTPLTSVDCTRCNLMSFDLVSSLSLSPIGWLTFVVERQSQFSGLLYRFCVSVRTSSDSYSLISPWTIFAKCWLTGGPFLLSSLKSFAISDSTSSPLAQSTDLWALLCSVQLNQMSDLLKMFLTPWQQFFADEWPGQLVHLVAPFAILRLLLLDSPPLRFSRDAFISPKDLVMVDFKEGREEKSKSLTVPIAATWSSRQLAPCQFRRCPVWFVLRKFSAKKFLCSQWALADYCLGAFILEGKMRVLLRILPFFLEKYFPWPIPANAEYALISRTASAFSRDFKVRIMTRQNLNFSMLA